MTKTFRTLATVAVASLVLGALVAGPAEAKKRKPKPKPPVCAAYTSPDWATDAKTTVVTDAATADAPVEVTLTAAAGLGFTSADGSSGDTPEGGPSHVYHNVQVDSAAASAKLFVRAEFTEAFDYDLFLRLPDITAVAYEADFNPATANGPTPVGGMEGSSAGPGWSQIDGYSSLDCDGYTVDFASGISPGEDITLKFWLEQ